MIWLKHALKELRYDVLCTLFVNNTEAKDIAENSKINEWTKHIDVRYYYTREKLLERKFFLFHISSAQNHANLMTKPLRRQLYDKHTRLLACNSKKKCWNLPFIRHKKRQYRVTVTLSRYWRVRSKLITCSFGRYRILSVEWLSELRTKESRPIQPLRPNILIRFRPEN
jgi:hypothetical protein